jgi:hypothetical protein
MPDERWRDLITTNIRGDNLRRELDGGSSVILVFPVESAATTPGKFKAGNEDSPHCYVDPQTILPVPPVHTEGHPPSRTKIDQGGIEASDDKFSERRKRRNLAACVILALRGAGSVSSPGILMVSLPPSSKLKRRAGRCFVEFRRYRDLLRDQQPEGARHAHHAVAFL